MMQEENDKIKSSSSSTRIVIVNRTVLNTMAATLNNANTNPYSEPNKDDEMGGEAIPVPCREA